MKLELHIYDENGEVARTAQGEMKEIKMGTIEDLMDLLDIDSAADNFEILTRVTKAYKEIRGILTEIFEDVTIEEWRNVTVKEIGKTVLLIVQYTFLQMMEIPTEKN